jgi:uncharacterized protein (TIGR03382 family)
MPDEALAVRLDFDDGATTLMVTADARRADPCGEACGHGFSAPFPEALRDGETHSVRAFVGDVALEGSPKSVRCDATAPADAAVEADAALEGDAAPDAAVPEDAAAPDAFAPEDDAAGSDDDGGPLLPIGPTALRSEARYEGGCEAVPGAPAFTLLAFGAGLALRRRRRR